MDENINLDGFLTKEEMAEVGRIKDYIGNAIMKDMLDEGELIEETKENLPCSCRCMKEDDFEIGDYLEMMERLENGMDSKIRRILGEICKFSRDHGLCQCLYYRTVKAVEKWDEERKREEEQERKAAGLPDDELPFK